MISLFSSLFMLKNSLFQYTGNLPATHCNCCCIGPAPRRDRREFPVFSLVAGNSRFSNTFQIDACPETQNEAKDVANLV